MLFNKRVIFNILYIGGILFLGFFGGYVYGVNKHSQPQKINLKCAAFVTPLTNPNEADIFMSIILSCIPMGEVKERKYNDVQTG